MYCRSHPSVFVCARARASDGLCVLNGEIYPSIYSRDTGKKPLTVHNNAVIAIEDTGSINTFDHTLQNRISFIRILNE